MPNFEQTDREFHRLMGSLEDWYADSVQAQDYAGNGGTPTHGHAILCVQPYPGPAWRRLWKETLDHADPLLSRAAILRSLEDELFGLSHGPSRVGKASGLHPHTDEWRVEIATAEGSLRAVARRFGVSHTTVRALRLQVAAGVSR